VKSAYVWSKIGHNMWQAKAIGGDKKEAQQSLVVKHNMVTRLPKFFPPNGVCQGCILNNYHWDGFEIRKYWRPKTQL